MPRNALSAFFPLGTTKNPLDIGISFFRNTPWMKTKRRGLRVQAIGWTAWGYAAVCAIWGLRTGRIGMRALRYAAFTLLACSITVTTTLVIAEGMDVLRTILPLHLCSACALVSLFYYAHPTRAAFEFLYYVGMPGAALALCFPAVAVSRHQDVMDACFFLTHAMVVFAPVLSICAGERPREEAALRVYGELALFAAFVYAANRLLGANYLFLMAAPMGTPLTAIYRWGEGVYRLVLAALALAVVLVGRQAAHLMKRRAL